MTNTNTLEGWRCPCGNEARFLIYGEAQFVVTDSGVTETVNPTWNAYSKTHCPECGAIHPAHYFEAADDHVRGG